MKKIVKSVFVFILTLSCLCGCGGESEKFDTEKYTNNQDENNVDKNRTTNIVVSDLFCTKERRIWFFTNVSRHSTTISINDDVSRILVIENGMAKGMKYSRKRPQLRDFDSMTDDEIIENLPLEDYDIKFSYISDDTGNNMKEERMSLSPINDTSTTSFGTNFGIGTIYEPQTVLSKQYFGFETEDATMRMVTKYDFAEKTQIVLNSVNDEIFQKD